MKKFTLDVIGSLFIFASGAINEKYNVELFTLEWVGIVILISTGIMIITRGK